MTDNLYDVLGIFQTANLKTIKEAYRKLSKKHHPDVGGDADQFHKINLAYEVLSDPERRARYDSTGRIDESPITPEKVRRYIDQTMSIVIEATRPDGTTDNPSWENILDKMILSLAGGRVQVSANINSVERKLNRTNQLLKRFTLKKAGIDGFDPVGDSLRREKERLEGELRGYQDAMELSKEVERVLKGYDYELGPDAEGQPAPSPTRRLILGGPRFTSVYRDHGS